MSTKYHNTIECPSCGAPLQQRHFILYCKYCGYVETVDGIDRISKIDNDSALSCYEYIAQNDRYIRTNGFVYFEVSSDNQYNLLTKRPFSPNNGRWEKNNDLSIQIIYTNDSVEDHIFFKMQSNNMGNLFYPYFAILLNGEYVIRIELIETADAYYFEINIVEFTLICMASKVDVSTNLIDLSTADFREFKTYCCRFYNQVFDRTKYLYSLNTRLITDNIN